MIGQLHQLCIMARFQAALLVNDHGIQVFRRSLVPGIILFFIIGCEFFINYKISLRKAGGKEEA